LTRTHAQTLCPTHRICHSQLAPTQAALAAAKADVAKAAQALASVAQALSYERSRRASAGTGAAALTNGGDEIAALRADLAKEKTRSAEVQKRAMASLESLQRIARDEQTAARAEVAAERERAAMAAASEAEVRAAMADLLREKARHAGQLRAAEAAITAARAEAAEAKAAQDGSSGPSQAALDAARAATKAADDLCAALHSELEASKAAHASVAASLAELVAEQERTSAWAPDELTDATARLAATQSQLAELQVRLASAQRAAVEAEAARERAQAEAQAAVAAANTTSASQQVPGSDAAGEGPPAGQASVRWELRRARERCDELQAALTAAQEEARNSAAGLASASGNIKQNTELLTAAAGELRKEREAKAALETELQEARAELKRLRSERETARGEVARLSAQLQGVDSLRADADALRVALNSATQQVASTAVALEAKTHEAAQAQAELASLRAQQTDAIESARADAVRTAELAQDAARAAQAQLQLEREAAADAASAAAAALQQARSETAAARDAAAAQSEVVRGAGLSSAAQAREVGHLQSSLRAAARAQATLSRQVTAAQALTDAQSRAALEALSLVSQLLAAADEAEQEAARGWVARLLSAGTSPHECVSACEALAALAKEEPAAFGDALAAGAARGVCCCMAVLAREPDVQLWGADVLSRVPASIAAGRGGATAETVLPWAAALLAAALRRHTAHDALQLCGFQALLAILSSGNSDPAVRQARAAGAYDAAKAAVNSGNEALADSARKVLAILGDAPEDKEPEPEVDGEDAASMIVGAYPPVDGPLPVVSGPVSSPVAAPAKQPAAAVSRSSVDMDAVYRQALEAIAAAAASSALPRSGEDAPSSYTPMLPPVSEKVAPVAGVVPAPVPAYASVPAPAPPSDPEAESRNTWRPKRR